MADRTTTWVTSTAMLMMPMTPMPMYCHHQKQQASRRFVRQTSCLYRADALHLNHLVNAVNFFEVADHLLSMSHNCVL